MLRVLRHRNFALLWIGQSVSLLGDGIYTVAIAWLVYDISNAPSALGLVGLAWTAPQIATLLLAGVVTDRYERRLIVIVADLLRVVAIGALGLLALFDLIELWHVVLLVIVYGVGEALFLPAFTAIVPEVVPKAELLQASALKEFMEPVGFRFAGPALGGLLIAVAGVATAFLIDAATFAVSAVVVSLMSRLPRPVPAELSIWMDLREGFAFMRARPWLWVTLASAAIALLASFGPLDVLLPYLIRNDLGGDAATFGTVLAAGGLGSITAALVLSRLGAPRRHVTFMYAGWAVSGALTAGFAVTNAAWQMCAVAFVSFASATAGMVVWSTLMQTLVPAEMLGRVASLDWFVSFGLVPVSFALTGPIAELVGAKETLIGAGVIASLSCAFVFLPGVRDPEAQPLPGGRRQVAAAAADP